MLFLLLINRSLGFEERISKRRLGSEFLNQEMGLCRHSTTDKPLSRPPAIFLTSIWTMNSLSLQHTNQCLIYEVYCHVDHDVYMLWQLAIKKLQLFIIDFTHHAKSIIHPWFNELHIHNLINIHIIPSQIKFTHNELFIILSVEHFSPRTWLSQPLLCQSNILFSLFTSHGEPNTGHSNVTIGPYILERRLSPNTKNLCRLQ